MNTQVQQCKIGENVTAKTPYNKNILAHKTDIGISKKKQNSTGARHLISLWIT